jgi:hypothetical protein
MTIDPRRRARQLARKAAKRKAQLAARKKDAMGSWARASIAGWPVYECHMPKNLFQVGLGDIIISRKIGDRVAAAVFLVDAGCLGVKDAFLKIISTAEYRKMADRIGDREELVPVSVECARKLIESAVEYAAGLGFKPHKGYDKAKPVFGEADAALCETPFEFGREGKPFYCSGPYESPGRRRQIIETLRKRCGADGFHYLIGLGDASFEDYELEEEGVEMEEMEETDTFDV